MSTYKISILYAQMDASENPPAIVKDVFPGKEFQSCMVDRSSVTVTFTTPQTPADLGPLVNVELLPSE